MNLFPDELRIRLPPRYSQEAETDPMVYARYYLPESDRVWFVLEGQSDDQDYLFFGFVAGITDEFAEFRLSELKRCRGPNGQTVTLDLTFVPGTLTNVVPASDL